MKREQGNISRKILASLLLVAAVAAFFYGRVLLAAPPVPIVTITAPSNGDAISGIIAVDADYSINAGNVHSLYLSVDGVQVDSVEVHARTGSYSFSLDTSSLDDGSHDITVEAYTAAKPSGHFSDNSITVNVVTPVCSSDVDCDDSDDYTEDSCSDPGLVTAACSNLPIACLSSTDCDDSDSYTEDICEDGATSAASCVHNAINCLSDADCDDGNALTLDGCANSGTTDSACSYYAIACNSDTDCDDSNAYTINSCVNGGTVMAACKSKAVACLTAADCDDADNYTEDKCDDAGMETASCVHSAIACLTAADCDDANDITTDSCENAGTANSACAHVACDVACASDADCDDGNALTTDTCVAAETCEATCEHEQIVAEEPVTIEEPVIEPPVVEEPVVEEPVVEPEPPTIEEPEVETPEPPVVEEPVVEEPVVEPEIPVVEEPVVETEPTVVEEPSGQLLSLNILSPANGMLTNRAQISITGTTLPGAAVKVGDATVTAGGAGVFSAVVSIMEGDNAIDITATSAADTITQTLTITSDTIAPSVLSVSPLDEANARISARIADNPGGSGIVASSVRMELNGDDVGCIYYAADGTCSASGLTFGSGAQTLIISANDVAGNAMMSSYFIEKTDVTFNSTNTNINTDSFSYPDMTVYSSISGRSYQIRDVSERYVEARSSYIGNPDYKPENGVMANIAYDTDKWKIRINRLIEKNGVLEYHVEREIDSQDGAITDLALSPDGKKISFIQQNDNHKKTLFVADDNGENVVVAAEGGQSLSSPVFSNDGSKALFVSDAQGLPQLMEYDLSSGVVNQIQLSGGKYPALSPVYSRDMRSIYFITNKDGWFDAYKVSAAGGEATRITNTPEREVALKLGADGELLCSIKKNGSYDIYRIDLVSGVEFEVIQSDNHDLAK